MAHKSHLRPDQLLRVERERRGWSRGYIAEQIGVDIATVGRWERGERLPHPHYRQQLCLLFNKKPEDLGLLFKETTENDEPVDMPAPPPPLSLEEEERIMHSPPEEAVPTTRPGREASSTLSSTQDSLPLPTIDTFQLKGTPSQRLPLIFANQQNRQRMLKKMYAFWITGVLEQSLQGNEMIALEFKVQPDAVIDPWRLTWQQSEYEPRPLSTDMHISQIYDEANGELLILGGPGSGKTTILLELTRVLLKRASKQEEHPIPVIFHLASWAIRRQPLENWLIEELHSKYQVPRKLASAWVQNEYIIPLLDGLDEVTVASRTSCIEAINTYRQQHGLLPVVVCSRHSDYINQHARLFLNRGIVIQPLRLQHIETYLRAGGKKLACLRHALQVDSILQELATNPLMLNILVLTYQSKTITTHSGALSLEALRREIFAHYVDQMLTHRKSRHRYTEEQTKRWLSWLARQLVQQQQAEFYIERMQPGWLSSSGQFRWYCRLLIGLLVGILGGITAMLADVPFYEVIHRQIFVLLTQSQVSNLQCADTLPAFNTFPEYLDSLFSLPTVGLVYGISFGLIGGFIGGLIDGKRPLPDRTKRELTRFQRLFNRGLALGVGLTAGSIFPLLNLLWVPCPLSTGLYSQLAEELSYGLAGVLVGGLMGIFTGEMFGIRKYYIQPVEALAWERAPNHPLLSSLVGGLLGIFIGGGTGLVSEVYLGFSLWQKHLLISIVTGGLLGSIIGRECGSLSPYMVEKYHLRRPNEGMWRSARNGLLVGLPVGLTLTLFASGLTLWLIPANITDGLLWCLPLGLIVTAILFLLNGGYACLQHLALRLVLYFQGDIPWHYSRFLDEAVERLLLRKVGGGYIFMHRLLLDYFAEDAPMAAEQSYQFTPYHHKRARRHNALISKTDS